MLIIVGILLMFTEVTSGLLFQDPVVCKFTVKRNECYVAEGQQLHLPMPWKEKINLKITDKTLTTHVILTKKINDNPQIQNAAWRFVTDNTTLILGSAERNNSGNYISEIFNASGDSKGTFCLQVNIEARVSLVKISHNCLASGVMKVDCSANGDDLRFNWTANFTTRLENGSHTVDLDKNYQGIITCHVENHVSQDHSSIQLRPCPEPSTSTAMTSASPSEQNPGTNSTVSHKEANSCNQTLTRNQQNSVIKSLFLNLGLIIVSSVSVLLFIVFVLAIYIYKKTHGAKNKEAISQEGRELVYAQPTHFSNDNTEPTSRTSQARVEDVEYAVVVPRASNKKMTYEDEVQYGELVFNTPAKNHRQTPKVQDDCIYSQVHHHS